MRPSNGGRSLQRPNYATTPLALGGSMPHNSVHGMFGDGEMFTPNVVVQLVDGQVNGALRPVRALGQDALAKSRVGFKPARKRWDVAYAVPRMRYHCSVFKRRPLRAHDDLTHAAASGLSG